MRAGIALAALLAAASATAADQALLPTVTRDEIVASTGKKKALVIAVCGDDTHAFRRAHLLHAVSFDAVVAGTAKLPKDHGSLIVFYSDDDGRVRLPQAIADLRARGYTNLRRFSGGLRGWKQDGGDVESDEATPEPKHDNVTPKGKE